MFLPVVPFTVKDHPATDIVRNLSQSLRIPVVRCTFHYGDLLKTTCLIFSQIFVKMSDESCVKSHSRFSCQQTTTVR